MIFYNKSRLGTGKISLDCINKNDAFADLTRHDKTGSKMLPLKPIIFEILKLKNTSVAQSNFDYMKMTLTEGKNKMQEQIDDANLLKDNILTNIRYDDGKYLLQKIVDVVSEETLLDHKCIQLIYLIESGVLLEHLNLFVLDEYISKKYKNFEEIDLFNKRCNRFIQQAVTYINSETTDKVSDYTKEYMENPMVTQSMKDHLNAVGTEWIRKTKSTNTIYKSFRRKGNMTQSQYVLFAEYVNKVRKALRTVITKEELCEIFKITPEIYEEKEVKALEPIDEILDAIIQYGDDADIETDDSL